MKCHFLKEHELNTKREKESFWRGAKPLVSISWSLVFHTSLKRVFESVASKSWKTLIALPMIELPKCQISDRRLWYITNDLSFWHPCRDLFRKRVSPFQSFKLVSKFISEYIWGNQFVLEELLAAFSNIPLLVHHSIANAHVLRRVQDFPVSYHFTEIKREFFCSTYNSTCVVFTK